MTFPLDPAREAAIVRQYEKNMARYPVIYREAEAFLAGKPPVFCLCMKYLWGHLCAQDILSLSPEVLGSYVNSTLSAMDRFDWLRAVPPEIFFPYVLYHRVNSEHADGSRAFLMEELLPHVRGASMEQAALAVNYWCCAHATYTPADDRTLGPLGILRRTLGRCGEESVLAVAALRSVGIPARQVYCPRWSHCDDNHAWVEVWIHGTWHYLGACEPESVLDRGWFTAAASRAMLVDTKRWDGDGLYEIVNCTGRYTPTRMLTVQVTENGLPRPGARVCFQVVNYSALYTLWEAVTDDTGAARFETGAGDLLVFARHGSKAALEKVDLRLRDSVTLELRQELPARQSFDLVPPEDSSGAVPYEDDPRHRQRLAQCEDHLAARRNAFRDNEGFLRLAAGNAPEIRRLLEDPRYAQAHKEELLSTLRPKDFVDITAETLTDALDTASPARGRYPADIYRDFLLAPRIADEMLLPERRKIRALFPRKFSSPQEILSWMQTHMEILPDPGIPGHWPSALDCLRCRQVPEFAFDGVFVALCRAFRFPARLDLPTGMAQWMDPQGTWHTIHPGEEPVALTLELPAGKKLNYFEHLTLARWDGRDFVTLKYPELTVEGRHTFRIRPGRYRITVTTRQIDGTASAALWHLTLAKDEILQITPPEDQTPRRLKRIPLSLPEGPLKAELEKDPGRDLLLIFADPGSEPTEHLLREMLEAADEFRALPCRILLLTEDRDHPTLALLGSAIPEAELLALRDPDALAALHRQMQVGDLRLPFVVCANRRGYGVYADANYRIRMARTLLDIQKLPDL